MALVKFSCGCIGINFQPKALVLAPCDGDRGDPYIFPYWRDLSDKSCEPLDPAKAHEVMDEVASLVHDGHRLRDIRSLLIPQK
jgi:hypothetical protein